MKELVNKMLDAEKDEWNEMQPPEQDVEGAYYTTVGITLFQMIDQNVCNLVLCIGYLYVATVMGCLYQNGYYNIIWCFIFIRLLL